ncbi:MAG: methyltransferase domain-containing protein [Deltaproteobacteria bacterium]|nr:methyltransferase domain-containing protein [Deltaproteobacteria bacterium]
MGAKVARLSNYNIAWLRRLFFFISSGLRKTLPSGSFKSIDNMLWRMELFLETLVSQRTLGIDSMIVIEKYHDGKRLLDLGCGRRKRKGAVGVDIVKNDCVDMVHDLNEYPYPFADNEFDDILLDNSLEHLNDIVMTMEEVWRISRPEALVTIKVPYFRNHLAIDPTHRQTFASHSFYYFDPTHEFHRLYRYSDKALFSVEKIVFDQGFRYCLKDKVRFSMLRYIANIQPLRYEEYLSHLMPLHELTFHLKALKEDVR